MRRGDLIAWNLPDSSTTAQVLRYTATVSPAAAGGQRYTNTATAKGSSLNDGKTDPLAPDNPLERFVTSSDTDTITVGSGTITKIADPESLTIGERGTWSIQIHLNPNVNFYNASIIDQLPGRDRPALVRDSSRRPATSWGPALARPPRPPSTRHLVQEQGRRSAGPWRRARQPELSGRDDHLLGRGRGRGRPHRSDVVTNTAHAAWDLTPGAPPTSVAGPFDQRSIDASASVSRIPSPS